MTKTLKALLLGAAVCTLPLTASAVTLFQTTAPTGYVTTPATYAGADVAIGDTVSYFAGVTATDTVSSGAFAITFENAAGLVASLSNLVVNNVSGGLAPAMPDVAFSTLVSGSDLVVTLAFSGFDYDAPNPFTFSGDTASFDVDFASPVPLPAGGVLLLTALGAAGLVRRRKG